MLLPSFLIGQNLVTNGDFQSNTGNPVDNWSGFNHQSLVDNLTSSNVGNVNNGEGSLFQEFAVTAGTTYQVTFDYRWVSGTGNYNMTVRFRGRPSNTNFTLSNVTGGTLSGDSAGLAVNTTPDTWYKASFSVTVPTGESLVRLLFYKGNGNRPFRLDNVSVRKLHTFDGSTDSDWATASNWDTNEIPDDDDVIIPSGQNVVISSTTGPTVGNLNINATGSLTINGGGSLILKANATGNITYNRTLQADRWHLVSSPVVGATYNDTWMTNNDIATGTGTNRGISMYQNGVADPTTGQWTYVQTGGTGTFEMSTGYALRRASTGTVSFIGTYPIGAQPASVTSPTATGTNKFNMVGNPFPTYLSVADFFTNNPSEFGKLTEETIWVWNQSSSTYDQKTSALDGTFQIAPGQAFFISSGNAADIFFYQFNGTHQTDTFLKNERTKLTLNMVSNNNVATTELYYLAEGTNEFDNGYDASKFTGVATSFGLHTAQLSDDTKKLGRQVLSIDELENLVVPVGVKAPAGQEITFSAEAMNLPQGIQVFLEDRENNTITRLDESNTTYKVTLSEALDGIDRFFLHTKTSGVLGTDDMALQNVHIFKTNNATLKILGLDAGNANLQLFNILGKQVLNSSFQSKGTSEISLPKLATGIYIVKLQSENGSLNKKIVLE